MSELPRWSIYRSPWLYRWVMAGLYGVPDPRIDAVAALLPDGVSVLDVCCGPATLGSRISKRCGYRGIELNERLCRHARGHGLEVTCADVRRIELPRVDFVVMMSSLYQFPDPLAMARRLQGAARCEVIITEPVVNLADVPLPGIRRLVAVLTDPGVGAMPTRLDRSSLEQLAVELEARELTTLRGGRELLLRLPGLG